MPLRNKSLLGFPCWISLTNLFILANFVLFTSRNYAGVLLGNDDEAYDGFYWVNATVGTPRQHVALLLDTGSSDTWVFGPVQSFVANLKLVEDDDSQSSTSKIINRGAFSISYVDTASAAGDYVSDNFGIGSIMIKDAIIGVARQVHIGLIGVLGIGFDSLESITWNGGNSYKNIIDLMVKQGLINSRAYSLWLNDIESQTGGIMFGGIDTGKYKGKLIGVPIQPDAQTGQIDSMTVAWTSLSVNDPTQGNQPLTENGFKQPAVLDSGAQSIFLPQGLYEQVASLVNVISTQDQGDLVECEAMQSYEATLEFGIGGSGGPVISVPFSELAVPLLDAYGYPTTFKNGNTACVFGMTPVPDDAPISLGDPFLRAAYVVYDLDRRQIALAPTVFNSEISNIVEILAPGSSNQDPWDVANSVSVQQTATARPEGPGLLISATATGPLSYVPTATAFHLPTSDISQPSGYSQSSDNAEPPKTSAGAASSNWTAGPGILTNIVVCVVSIFVGTTLIFGG
ncbi:hypothetical protein N7510_006938 [Penicillium lagena]|uniref:uncharacterized protein n=1 Tax=Penicillium lagena TaxID=94218 RepID=UPI0025412756|nr:uncharacterized protein N7510_006938 [Penicillium lagena]KAJ5610219.1 hypothetical protein N7510_006938 [Penicillium lagena]